MCVEGDNSEKCAGVVKLEFSKSRPFKKTFQSHPELCGVLQILKRLEIGCILKSKSSRQRFCHDPKNLN